MKWTINWPGLREPVSPLVGRLLGVATVGLVALLWWLVTWGDTPEARIVSPVILPSPAEVLGSLPLRYPSI